VDVAVKAFAFDTAVFRSTSVTVVNFLVCTCLFQSIDLDLNSLSGSCWASNIAIKATAATTCGLWILMSNGVINCRCKITVSCRYLGGKANVIYE
jgi:hypothetical protein